ncbi:MAG: hypothetical protein NVV59_07985 [Chitinophagaceae bacterium]|nr:hypothetical protein [Chitinophagaceae bacterium]
MKRLSLCETFNMARKRWEAKTEITPELVQAREKRKWQINLRRYVIEKSPCPSYAPYFGLDITSMRKWFEQQFTGELTWNNFGDQWQFTHIMPLYLFDHENDDDLRLCWNFINLRVEPTFPAKPAENRLSLLAAKVYFEGIVKNERLLGGKRDAQTTNPDRRTGTKRRLPAACVPGTNQRIPWRAQGLCCF